MRTRRTIAQRTLATVAVAGLAIALTACSDDDAPAGETTSEATVEASEEPAAETSEEATEDEAADDAPATDGDLTAAEWAKPLTTPGELLTTIEGDGFSVAVYQVGTTAATKTGFFVDPDSNQPIIDEGDEIVFVNYVVTNTGSEAIPLSHSLVGISARYDDWPYLQGMDSISDSALFEQMDVNDGGLGIGVGDAPFAWEPGTSYTTGENFKYQSGSPIGFAVSLTPADEAGDLVHDERQEVEGTATIQ